MYSRSSKDNTNIQGQAVGFAAANIEYSSYDNASAHFLNSFKHRLVDGLVLNQAVFTPEDLCHPWNDLPPYSCTKITSKFKAGYFESLSLTLGNATIFYYLILVIVIIVLKAILWIRRKIRGETSQHKCSCTCIIRSVLDILLMNVLKGKREEKGTRHNSVASRGSILLVEPEDEKRQDSYYQEEISEEGDNEISDKDDSMRRNFGLPKGKDVYHRLNGNVN